MTSIGHGHSGGDGLLSILGTQDDQAIVGKVCFGISGDYGYESTLIPTAERRLLFGDEVVFVNETVVFSDETVNLREPNACLVYLDSGHTEAKLKDVGETISAGRVAQGRLCPAGVSKRFQI